MISCGIGATAGVQSEREGTADAAERSVVCIVHSTSLLEKPTKNE
jgi:hypothetical protein